MEDLKQYNVVLLNNGIYGFVKSIDTKNNIVYLLINPVSCQYSKCYIFDIKEIIEPYNDWKDALTWLFENVKDQPLKIDLTNIK